MQHFHQQDFYVQAQAPRSVQQRVLKAVMLPFEVLHRQHWQAPWRCG